MDDGEECISDLPLEVHNTLPDGMGKIKPGKITGPEAKNCSAVGIQGERIKELSSQRR